jgi:hypothetical protein
MINILILMAGAGSRFLNSEYDLPKPLIKINNKPMIQAVVENLAIDGKYIYVVQKEHYKKYNLKKILNKITYKCNIVQTEQLTEGAACSALLAKDFINNKTPLLISNCDEILEWNSNDFINQLKSKNADGGIATFKASGNKWSYVKTGKNGIIVKVAEKEEISDDATVGVYYWKHGSDFVKYAEKMIKKNIRVNNEFYVSPVYNEAIVDNKIIYSIPVNNMWGIGTPEDLIIYLSSI